MAKRSSADHTTTTTTASTTSPTPPPRFRFRWLDAGIPQPDGGFHFHALEVDDTHDSDGSYVLHVGDTILLRNPTVAAAGQRGTPTRSNNNTPNHTTQDAAASERYYQNENNSSNNNHDDDDDDMAKYFGVRAQHTTSSTATTNDKDDDTTTTEPYYVARVELMKEDAPSSRRSQQYSLEARMKIRARWFLKRKDIETLDLHLTGDITRDDVLAHTTQRDLILTNHVDDNPVGTMMGPCSVIYRKPDPNDLPPPNLPQDDCFVCRYNLEFQGNQQQVVIPYDGKEDDWDTLLKDVVVDDDDEEEEEEEEDVEEEEDEDEHARGPPASKKARVHESTTGDGNNNHRNMSDTNDTITSEDDDEELSVSSGEYHVGDAPEAEGSATKGSIQVGPAHQAAIPPWKGSSNNSNDPTTLYKSPRDDPILMWEPRNMDTMTEDDMVQRLNDGANVLAEYLEKNGLIPDEPYSPLTAESTERFTIAQGRNKLMTLSSVSTASSLSSSSSSSSLDLGKQNRLSRECDVDKLLETWTKETCLEKAMGVLASNPQEFVTGWTKAEKEVFDARFRSYSGQLRMIAKSLAPTKSFKDVVDYYYRFKIPDQYRRYQEKKREQAVRMVECIETRRSYDNIIRDRPMSVGSKSKAASEWSRTGASDVVGAIEARRSDAKELLLEVRSIMGPAKMAEVADAVRSLSEHSASDLKYSLSEILQDQPELLQRFLEFLPKRQRT